ncbi:MAG: hypothetical protein Q4P20_10305 [Eubacteriales bacterium]|nr:hypothetical protein [Eubacteriales bacterium]
MKNYRKGDVTLARMGIDATTEACANCRYFYRHFGEHGYLIFYGHCCYPRAKWRKLGDVCDRFKPFVRKNDEITE